MRSVSIPDTIAAIASAPGRGAIGIIRVSGPKVPEIALALLGTVPAARIASLSRFLAADGSALDEGLALYFPAPASFTGEHLLELQGHGGAIVLDMVMQRLFALGCRAARPGEFSERAFVNGKIDIAQAEAVADLIDAGSAAAARAAVRSMRGEFSARIQELQRRLTELRKLVEAAIDFPDEEIEFASDSKLRARLAVIAGDFARITAAARQGALLREGLNVVIAGKPNAGKSSLLNRLAGDEIAIVTDLPGTTRDVLRQPLRLDGLLVNLIDTAGLRPTTDVIEAEGVRRARGEIGKADLVLYLVDAAANLDAGDLPAGVPVAVVVNKIDLLGMPARIDAAATPTAVHLSAKTGEGLDLLRAHIKMLAGYQNADSSALSARRRHLDALSRARHFVQQGEENFSRARALELFAEDLRLAQGALGEITGEFGSDDLLGEIFRSFCIGK
jgi:tRNA modification GTPase